jgi:hypothetical protein
MDDDGEMIARMVQDYLAEELDHAACHKDKIQEELEDMRHLIKHIGEGLTTRSRGIKPSALQIEEKSEKIRMRVSPRNIGATCNIPHQP